MSLILAIETTTGICSVAIGRDGRLIALRESAEGYSHARQLTLFISELLVEADCSLPDLDAIAVSGGPGSYTGLRIGTSTAKGLCFALGKPLLSVNTLQAMALGASGIVPENTASAAQYFHPMIDARRMEVYTCSFNAELQAVSDIHAQVMDDRTAGMLAVKFPGYYFGDGAEKCRELFSTFPSMHYLELLPSAKYLLPLAEQKFEARTFENTALYEPFYLKDFVAGVRSVQ